MEATRHHPRGRDQRDGACHPAPRPLCLKALRAAPVLRPPGDGENAKATIQAGTRSASWARPP